MIKGLQEEHFRQREQQLERPQSGGIPGEPEEQQGSRCSYKAGNEAEL
jgi:hypothetical protein